MAITIVGLGPGDGRLLTREAWRILSTAETVYLRTGRHPAVADLPDSVKQVTFDAVYDTADDFQTVYERIAAEVIRLGRLAVERGDDDSVIYAVPGHPLVGEATVSQILMMAEREGLPATVVPGVSFVEPALTAVRVDALDGLQLFDAIEVTGYNHPPLNPDLPLLLGQLYGRPLANEVKLVLMTLYPDDHEVVLIHAAGTEKERLEKIPLYMIDRSERVGHLTSLYIPPLPHPASLTTLAETVATLRSPQGCPWDREQTPQSMRPGFLEEVYEALAALDSDDPEALCEELGDVLYHLIMQAQMATETGDFRLVDVVAGIDAKLKRRHPHVWGDWQVADSDEVVRNWRQLKRQEKAGSAGQSLAPSSLLDNIPPALPALAYSQKIQERVGRIGFDWPDIAGVVEKVAEELVELKAAASPEERRAELGDILFAVVNWARWLGLDAETALREANLRFTRRFHHMEQLAGERNLTLAEVDFDTLNLLWEEAKEKV